MSDLFIKVYRNVWPITLAILVHIILFALMSVNLDWTRQLKPAAMQPMQAVAIIEPLPLPELSELVPEPEPELEEPEPEPPKPKPKPKPVKTIYSYPCAGKQLETDSAGKATALQEDCEEDERKKKAEEEKKKQEKLDVEKKRKADELKKKEAAEKKREVDERKQKEAAEKKRKADARKKKEAAERKKKAAAEKKRKAAERKKKEAAEKKRKAQAAQRAKAERELKVKLDREGAERAWGAALGGADGSGRAVANHVGNNYRYNPTCVGKNSTWLIEVTPTGQILGITMKRGSGNDTCNREAGLAIKNSNPLPIHVDWPTAKPDKFEFNFKPE